MPRIRYLIITLLVAGLATLPVLSPIIIGQAPRIIVLRFDDATADQLAAYQVMRQHGFVGVFGIPTGLVGKHGRMTWQDVWYLNETGSDIASHTQTHPMSLDNLSAGALRSELVGSLDDFHWQGLHPKGFIYPGGSGWNNNTVLLALRNAGYLWASRSGNHTYDIGSGNPLKIPTFSIDNADNPNSTSDAYFQSIANLASGSTVVVFLFHHVGNATQYSISLDSFSRKVDWLKANGFDVVPLSKALTGYKNASAFAITVWMKDASR